jgi:hypothetical protein
LAKPTQFVLFEKGDIFHAELDGLFGVISGSLASVFSHSEEKKECDEAQVSCRLQEQGGSLPLSPIHQELHHVGFDWEHFIDWWIILPPSI